MFRLYLAYVSNTLGNDICQWTGKAKKEGTQAFLLLKGEAGKQNKQMLLDKKL